METLPRPRSTDYEQAVLDGLNPDNKQLTPQPFSEREDLSPELSSDFNRQEEFSKILNMLAARGVFRGIDARMFIAGVDTPAEIAAPPDGQTPEETPQYSPDMMRAISVIDGKLAQIDQNDPKAREHAIKIAERQLFKDEGYHPDIAKQKGRSEQGVADVKDILHDARRSIGPFAS